jgi:hypothetical protein
MFGYDASHNTSDCCFTVLRQDARLIALEKEKDVSYAPCLYLLLVFGGEACRGFFGGTRRGARSCLRDASPVGWYLNGLEMDASG